MEIVLWLLGLLILLWWVVLPFSIGTTVGPRHPTMKLVMRLLSLAMLVGLVYWQLNPEIRVQLFVAMTLCGFVIGTAGTQTYKKDEGTDEISFSTFTPGVSRASTASASIASASIYSSSPAFSSTPTDSSRCARCKKPLKEMADGFFTADSFVASVTSSPYPCKSCGTVFCVDCMSALKKAGGTCSNCRGALRW